MAAVLTVADTLAVRFLDGGKSSAAVVGALAVALEVGFFVFIVLLVFIALICSWLIQRPFAGWRCIGLARIFPESSPLTEAS